MFITAVLTGTDVITTSAQTASRLSRESDSDKGFYMFTDVV